MASITADLPRVVVIGSGPCGAIAARELARRDMHVTMLESGRRRPPGALVRFRGNTLLRWVSQRTLVSSGRHTGSRAGPVRWYHDLAPGGLSNHWTSAVPRFAREDFHDGARLDGAYDWPISYDDLEPYYEEVEQLIRVTGSGTAVRNLPAGVVRHHRVLPARWDGVAHAADALGHGVDVMPMARGRPTMVALRGTEFNSYTNVVKPLLGRRNFTLLRGAHATSIRWSSARGAADGVNYIERSGRRRPLTVTCDAVVVAAGALNSTRVLLGSRSGDFPTGLGNDHDVLGRYLHDHPMQWWPFRLDHPLPHVPQPVYVTRHDHAHSEPLAATAWMIGAYRLADRARPLIHGSGRDFGAQVFGTTVPRPDSRVSLTPDTVDDVGQARLVIDTTFDSAALDRLAAASGRLAEIFAASGNPLAGGPPADPPVPGMSVHWGGTARMHADPRLGVVDGWNRIHSAPNVVVADASCFTTGPEKNPTLTAMAIAARAARHLADDLLAPAST